MVNENLDSPRIPGAFTEQNRPDRREYVRLVDYIVLLLAVSALVSAVSREHYAPARNAVPTVQHQRGDAPADQTQSTRPILPES